VANRDLDGPGPWSRAHRVAHDCGGCRATRANLNPVFFNARTTRSPRTDGNWRHQPINRQGQLVGANVSDQAFECLAQVRDRASAVSDFDVSPHARTQ